MQQRRNITCLQLKTHKNYYLSTARYKEELFPVYNKQQIGNITCRQQTTKKNYYLPTTKIKEVMFTCLQHATKKNFYLSTTHSKEEYFLFVVCFRQEIILLYCVL
jgi:hypothetical protein